MGRKIGRYNKETGKVEWIDSDMLRQPKDGESAAIWGPVEFRAVGLKGAPIITSRNQYKALLRQNGCVEVGNEEPAWMSGHRESRRTHG